MTSTVTLTKKKKKKTVAEIFDWAISEIHKAAGLYEKRKKDIILETARKLDEDTDIEKGKICQEITVQLGKAVSAPYVREVLKDFPQFKEQYRVKNAQKTEFSAENRAKQAQPTQSQIEKHAAMALFGSPAKKQEEQDDAPTGHYQMPFEEFKIRDVDIYNRDFLIDFLKHLFSVKWSEEEKGRYL